MLTGVPLIYGTFCGSVIAIFGLVSWKLGWTLAPPSTPLFRMLFTNWQALFLKQDFGELFR